MPIASNAEKAISKNTISSSPYYYDGAGIKQSAEAFDILWHIMTLMKQKHWMRLDDIDGFDSQWCQATRSDI